MIPVRSWSYSCLQTETLPPEIAAGSTANPTREFLQAEFLRQEPGRTTADSTRRSPGDGKRANHSTAATVGRRVHSRRKIA